MVDVTDGDSLAPHVDHNSAVTSNRDGGGVGQGDVLIVNTVVVGEDLVVWPEVVGGAAVKDGNFVT